MKPPTVLFTTALLAGLAFGAVWGQAPRRPNVVVIFADDLGYGDLYSPKPEYWDVPLMRNEQVIERPVDHRTLTKRYTEEAVRFIAENKSGPFFLYLAHSLPQIPLARSDEFVGHSAGGMYGDVIEEIDWSVGRVLDALRAAGVERNTLVLFTSDNGPWLPFRDHGGSAGSLRQGKGSTWEGGVRTPAIFSWPGTIRPGVVTDRGSGLDLLATAASLAGVRVPADRPIDRLHRLDRGAQRHRAQSPQRVVLLLGQRAEGRAEGQVQGALHHQWCVRRPRAANRARPATAV